MTVNAATGPFHSIGRALGGASRTAQALYGRPGGVVSGKPQITGIPERDG